MEANTQLINLNLMTSLRTNNLIVDMAIAMFVPQLMNLLVELFNRILPLANRILDKCTRKTYRREIVYSYEARPYYDIETSSRNGILQHAIRLYLGRVLKNNYHEGIIKLAKVEGSNKGSESHGGSIVDQLEKDFRVLHLPQKSVFEEIEPGLRFMETYSAIGRNDDDEDGGKKRKNAPTKTLVTMIFETNNVRTGPEKVQQFIDKAYNWYCEEVERQEDKSRFMYQPLVRERFATVEERRKPRIYKRYKLSSEKTFRSLFFPEKERLLHILKHFEQKTGKYSIKGFPHKLGLLLHGPPGTGKTSLVKAIATHTGRSIVAVPLSRIHTNQELMDVMFDQMFNYSAPKKNADEDDGDSQGSMNRLEFKDVIFLLEDVDAASTVVHARNPAKSTMAKQQSHLIERQYSVADLSGNSGGATPTSSPALADTTTAAAMLTQQKLLMEMLQRQKAESGTAKSTSKGTDGETGDADKDKEKKEDSFFLSDKDKLNLSGLLGVLDGIIDAPGRILIMTTNHPEKLDPALTRPGRVNLQIYMGFIRIEQAKEMIAHYYGSKVTAAQLTTIERAFEELHRMIPGGFKLSPAEMEQLCAECSTIEVLHQKLMSKGTAHLLH